jgi:N-acetylneuraminic acid mutarotase
MKRHWLYILFFIPALSSCLESPEMTSGTVNAKEEPTVATLSTDPIPNDGSLLFQGEITYIGKGEIIEKGFYWWTDFYNPDVKDTIVVISDVNTGVFEYELKNALGGKKTYYWQAYVINSYGEDKGEVRSCETPEIWIEKRPFPTDSRGRGVVFILINKIYMTCGVKFWNLSSFVDDTWEYAITSNDWGGADSIAFPGDKRIDPVYFTIGNLAFVGTGSQANLQAYKDFYQFNAGSKKWMEIDTPDDFEARFDAAAFGLDGKGYVVGGMSADNKALNDVWQYNPNDNSWEKKGNFPVNFNKGISISGNNRAFVGFGLGDTSESRRTLWKYDDVTDSWDVFAEFPDETTNVFSGVIVQNVIYVVDEKNNLWGLNISDKTWIRKSDFPTEFKSENGNYVNPLLLTTGSSNSIYIGLGFTKQLYEYRPLWDN